MEKNGQQKNNGDGDSIFNYFHRLFIFMSMKIVEQQSQFGTLLLTTETSDSGKKCFTIQEKDGGDIVIGNLYEEEINLNDLFACLSFVNNFFKQNDR